MFCQQAMAGIATIFSGHLGQNGLATIGLANSVSLHHFTETERSVGFWFRHCIKS